MTVVLTLALVWLALGQGSDWRAKRAVHSCWERELAKSWSEDPGQWKPLHDQTMDVIRRHRRQLFPFLAASLEPRNDGLRERVCQFLNHIPFIRWRPEARPDWSNTALSCLQELGPEAKPAVPMLEKMLHRPGASRNAALALMAVGPEAIPCFERGFASPNSEVRLAILEGLGNSDLSSTREALPLLLRALDDSDRRVQGAAAGLIGAFPELRGEVSERLVSLLEACQDPAVASGPAFGLALFGGDAVDPLLRIYVETTNRAVRCAAYGALVVAQEMSHPESATRERGATLNQLRCFMNAKTLSAAWFFYAKKEDEANEACTASD